jgi:hypothetical protein
LDKSNTCGQTALDIYYALGWLNHEYPLDIQFPIFINFLLNAIQGYEESIFLRTAIPNIKFHFSAILFDFSPLLTVGLVKTVLAWLMQASELAKKHAQDDLFLVSSIRCHKEMISPDRFSLYMEKTIQAVESKCGTLEDLENKDDNDPVAIEQLEGLRLFTLNI